MPKPKSAERLRAFEIFQQYFKQTKEELGPNEIAKKLTDEFGKEVSQRTVSGWKSRDEWLAWSGKERGGGSTYVDKKDQRTSKKQSSYVDQKAPKEQSNGPPGAGGPPLGNQNSKGGGAPPGNQNGLGNDGGAPEGNKNALTTGRYEAIMWGGVLTEEENELVEMLEGTDALKQIEFQIVDLTLRKRRMVARLVKAENGLSDNERLIISRLREVKKEEPGKNGKMVKVPTQELVVEEVHETTSRKIDKVMELWKHIADVDNLLIKAIQAKETMLGNSEKLGIAKERLELDRVKLLGKGENEETTLIVGLPENVEENVEDDQD